MQLYPTLSLSVTIVLLVAAPLPASSQEFLQIYGLSVEETGFKADIEAAMGAMLGCGGEVGNDRIAAIENALKPMWQTLPRNEHGRVERRSLRYAVHRYFMQQSSVMIRGFEPSRPTNQSDWGVADILSQQVPGYVEAVLESQHAQQKGFTLDDAVHLVIMLEKLVFEADRMLLEKIYRDQRKPMQATVTYRGLMQILEAYLFNWMVGEDVEANRLLAANHTLAEQTLPQWNWLRSYAEGQARALDFQRQHFNRNARNAFTSSFSFDEVTDVVGSITKTFSSFWESECATMRNALVEMDTYGTGRVPLSNFYAATVDGEWRFAESEEYLREIGALDETSSMRGKEVVIANYIQGPSNCVISTPHYLVCCVNECEIHMGEIEVRIGAPTATPTEILAVVQNMTAHTTIDDDEPPNVTGSLTAQLEQVANSNGGKVPLHGRLFAQWLHYVFPRECAFPHKTGVAASVTPLEFGNNSMVKKEDMQKHAANASVANVSEDIKKEDLQWMSQWSEEEEFRMDYSAELHAPWEQQHTLFIFATVCFAVVGLWWGVIKFGRSKSADCGYSSDEKMHMV